MERRQSQILFHFLPNDTFDHANNSIIGRVQDIRGKPTNPDLPARYILDRIEPKLRRWDDHPRFSPASVNFVEPQSLEFEVFPRNFECARCGTVNQRRDGGRRASDSGRCDECGRALRDMDQQQLVQVCKCGRLESLWVPEHCDDEPIQLQRQGSGMSEAVWVCGCGHRVRAMDRIASCSSCGEQMEIVVHSSSRSFYPQIATFVNVEEDVDRVLENERFQKDVIVDYLMDGSDGATSLDPTDQLDSDTRRTLELLKEEGALDSDRLKELQEESQKRREGMKGSVESALSEPQIRSVSEEALEHRSLVDQEKTDSATLDGLYEKAKDDRRIDLGRIGRYRDFRDELNLGEVRLIRDFPVTTVVYGYSRLSHEPQEGHALRAFSGRGGTEDLYIHTTAAEAVMVTLDQEALVSWLVENGFVTERPEEDTKLWLLDRLTPQGGSRPYPSYDEIPQGTVRRPVLTLLHSLSHAFVNAIDALSGYSKESLVEYLLPRTLSFAVYKRSDTDFSLGSIYTLIEDRFDLLHEYLRGDGRDCIYDPVCEREEGSSCEGCLYLSTLSCQNANYNLARSTVYGGLFDEVEIEGFLEVDD